MEKSIAILFVDIVDSTRLYERLGNLKATALTRGLLHELRGAVERASGLVIKSLGDGLLCSFPDADSAAHAADDIIGCQDQFDLRVRVGIHWGTVVETYENDLLDVVGDAVNVTARVESLARPGEILATADLVERLGPAWKLRTKLLDSTVVKGKTVPIYIYRILHRDAGDDSLESTVIGMNLAEINKGRFRGLSLVYRGTAHHVSQAVSKITIGRDQMCGIVIMSRQASRQHGAIEFSRESFIISDHSSNGTYIVPSGGQVFLLRRDATKLIGEGLIGIGAVPEAADQDYVITYSCNLD